MNEYQATNKENLVSYEGIISKIMFNDINSGYAILKMSTKEPRGKKRTLTVKGHIFAPVKGAKLSCTGELGYDAKYEEEYLKTDSALVDYRNGKEEVIRSLLLSEYIPLIGEKSVDLIVDHFGAETLDIIEKDPDRLLEIRGIGKVRTRQIREGYCKIAHNREFYGLLLPYLPQSVLDAILKKYKTGDRALAALKEDPYILYRQVDGVGFASADNVAKGVFGLRQDDERRIAAIISYVIEQEAQQNGHAFIWWRHLENSMERLMRSQLGGETMFSHEQVKQGLEYARRQKHVIIEKAKVPGSVSQEKEYCIYISYNWYYEYCIANDCMRVHENFNNSCGIVNRADVDQAIAQIQDKDGIELDDTQKQAVYTVFADDNKNVTVITGGPGSGKTTIIKTLLLAWEIARGDKCQDDEIMLCAPTGRAAARIREATGHRASTIHAAYYNPFHPQARILVVDEFSMCNLYTATMSFALAAHGCKMVIVGDPDQLPAIGAGNVLRDIIDCGAVNVCRLSSCHRNAGAIVENAVHINNGDSCEEFTCDDTFSLEDESGRKLQDAVLEHYYRLVKKYSEKARGAGVPEEECLQEGIKQVCLLSPKRRLETKASGSTAAENLNLIIRDKFNPANYENSGFISSFKASPNKGAKSIEFRVGDRVMLCKNHRGSFVNGDMGFITKFEPYTVDDKNQKLFNVYTVCFDNPCDVEGKIRTMKVKRAQMQKEFTLAYAMTVHKAQGSEFKGVVIAYENCWEKFLQRNMIYTAVTRSKNECEIIGDLEAVNKAIQNNDVEFRNTSLQYRILHYDPVKYPAIINAFKSYDPINNRLGDAMDEDEED